MCACVWGFECVYVGVCVCVYKGVWCVCWGGNNEVYVCVCGKGMRGVKGVCIRVYVSNLHVCVGVCVYVCACLKAELFIPLPLVSVYGPDECFSMHVVAIC